MDSHELNMLDIDPNDPPPFVEDFDHPSDYVDAYSAYYHLGWDRDDIEYHMNEHPIKR